MTRRGLLLILGILLTNIAFLMLFVGLDDFAEPVFAETTSGSRVLYLNDSWNDVPKDLRSSYYIAAEIKKVEVEGDAIIITANSTIPEPLTWPATRYVYYLIFFDLNSDNVTELCWGYTKSYSDSGVYSRLFRYKDQTFFFNGSWKYIAPTSARNFEGEIAENNTLGETTFRLGQDMEKIGGDAMVNGTLTTRLKVASLAQVPKGSSSIWEGDLVPGFSFSNVTKITLYQPAKLFPFNPCDATFPYENATVNLVKEEPLPPPPPPPPPPEEPRLNLLLQLSVWGIQGAAWFVQGVVNFPFWMRDNAVYGSLLVAGVVLSGYSLVKRWKTGRKRLKRVHDAAELLG